MTVSKKARQKQKQVSGVDTTNNSKPGATAGQQTQVKGRRSRQSLAAVWDSLPYEQQLQLLTIDLRLLHSRAYHVSGQPKLGEVLDTGVCRLRKVGKLRQWEITPGAGPLDHATLSWGAKHGHTMPQHEKDTLLPPNLKPASPHAKRRLQTQLTGIQQKMVAAKQARNILASTKPWRLSKQSYLIDAAITELLSGHEILYSVFADAIADAICELCGSAARNSQPAPAVDFDLLDMAAERETIDVARVSGWVETKISSFCKLAEHGADCTEEIPALTLTGPKAAATLAVSERWLHQLERLHQADGSTSSKAQSKSGSGRHLASGDAMLKWLCDWEPVLPCTPSLPGSMASKTPAQAALKQLGDSQDEVVQAASRAAQLQELIIWMEEDMQRPCNLKTHHDSRFRRQQRLPPRHMQSILQQEYHICKGDICCTGFKLYNGSLRLLKIGQRLSQVQAQHKHLMKLELAIQRHGMPMVFSDPASSDHQRAHVGRAMAHEHEMNAKVMQELKTRIQGLTEQSDATERDQLRLNQELEKISAWGDQLADLVAALKDLTDYFDKYAGRRSSGPVSLPEQHLRHLSDHFHEELQGKLCTVDRQAALLKSLQTQHKLMLQHLDEGCAVVELLRAQVVDAACDDPATLILPHLVMPLIKERLEAKPLEAQDGSSTWYGSGFRTVPSWDPNWPRNELAAQYKQSPAIVSCGADISLLNMQVATFVNVMSKAGYKDIHITFVDDLLLVQNHFLRPLELGFESTVLGGASGLNRDCGCLAALFFLS